MHKHPENNEENKDENKHPFSLPEGYFDSFSKRMLHKIELADELKEFEMLSSIEKMNPFQVPSSYFEIKEESALNPVLFGLKSKDVFTVPPGYFDESAQRILSKIEVFEELNNYSLLSGIKKESVFSVPENYFESGKKTLTEKLGNTEASGDSVKILHIIFNRKTAYAIAAILVISIGIYLFNPKEVSVQNDCNTLACLSRGEIINGAQINNLDEEALIEAVNTGDLKENLDKAIRKENTNKSNDSVEVDFLLENVDVNEITDEI